jgi:hypothetical protein
MVLSPFLVLSDFWEAFYKADSRFKPAPQNSSNTTLRTKKSCGTSVAAFRGDGG